MLPAKSGGKGRAAMKEASHSLAPSFLIAMPKMCDDSFAESVILLIDHGDDGAMGLVLNRPMDEMSPSMSDIAASQDVVLHRRHASEKVFQGGFVEQQRGFLLHDSPDLPDSVQLLPGLYLAVSVAPLKELLSNGKDIRYRFLLGYAGWAAGQLETELADGLWLPMDCQVQGVFDRDVEHSWENALRRAGVEPGRLLSACGMN